MLIRIRLHVFTTIINRRYTSTFVDCQVYQVGKPVYNRYSNATYGSWMKDPSPKTSNDTIWMTVEDQKRTLIEFSNKSAFKTNARTKQYDLNAEFHVSILRQYVKFVFLDTNSTLG